MRLKATWIIPGLLLTLLLGLLWAIPAFAASAGTIGFKDGSDSVSYVSLNGVGSAGNAITVTVTDSDLDPVVDVKITNDTDATDVYSYAALPQTALVLPAAVAADPTLSLTSELADEHGYTWHDVQDMTNDTSVDRRDFKVVSYSDTTAKDGGTKTTLPETAVNYNRSNGTLTITGTYHELSYKIKKQTVIGARNGTDRTAMIDVDGGDIDAAVTVGDTALNTLFDAGDDTPADATDDFPGPDESLIDGAGTDNDLTWVELLSSKHSSVLGKAIAFADDDTASTTDTEEIQTEIAALITAHNRIDDDNVETAKLAVTVTATVVENDDDEIGNDNGTLETGEKGMVSSVSVAFGSDCDDATQATGARTCTSRIGAIGPWTIDAGSADARSDDTWVNPADASDDTDIVVKVAYVGSASTIYPNDTHRIGEKDEVGRVTIDTNAMATPISVILQETSSASGMFSAKLEICDSDAAGCMEATQAGEADENAVQSTASRMIMVPVDNEGDSIVVRYKDADPSATRSATIALDATGPAFSEMAPASGTSGREDEPTVSFQVNDAESGLSSKDTDANTIRIVAGVYDLDNKSYVDSHEYLRNDLNPKAANNGYMTSFTLEEGSGNGELDAGSMNEYEIHWWAVAVDVAGNTNVSDADSTTKCDVSLLNLKITNDKDSDSAKGLAIVKLGDDDDSKSDDKACEPHKIRVDAAAPEMTDATTGVYLDGDKEKTGKATSVVARFNENLDCDTVSADDFTVGGTAANGASCKGMNVYLDVDELASDATPKVVVATGSVSDKAGNAIAGTDASRTKTASDGLAPNLTVTVTGTGAGDRPVTKGKITVAVTSDERLTGRPDVVIKKVGADYKLTGSDKGGDADPTGTTNEYSSSWTISEKGVYNVYVTGEDRSADSGTGSKGMEKLGSADNFKDSKAILFEVDTGVADPTYAPTKNGSTDNPNVFITVNFASEGNEYPINTDPKGTADDDTDDVKVDVDSHGTVTVTSAMFNGEAVEMNTRDNMLFTYRPGNLSLGDHKLELEVTDNAGNERKGTTKLTLSFTVKERAAWVLKLDAGTNLVSIPANPTDGAIDTVFGDEAITRVVTRDNATGLWMVASKGSDGSFAGDLDTIDAGHGYWVVSDAPVDVMIDLPPSGGVTVLPPAIKVVEGWNLVPIANPAQEKDGFEIGAKTYFANIKADVAYGYDSLTGTMTRIDASSGSEDNVMVGSGYWVYANEAGVIIP